MMAEDAAPQIRRRSAGVPPAVRRRSAGVSHAIRTGATPVPHRCRTGSEPVPHRCRRRSAADPHGYSQTARKAKTNWVFFFVFFGVFVLLGVFLCFFGGVFARRCRAAHPPAFRTRSALCSALVPHLCRTGSALVPHLCRTCAALVPHLCRTCAALWADLRRGVLCMMARLQQTGAAMEHVAPPLPLGAAANPKPAPLPPAEKPNSG